MAGWVKSTTFVSAGAACFSPTSRFPITQHLRFSSSQGAGGIINSSVLVPSSDAAESDVGVLDADIRSKAADAVESFRALPQEDQNLILSALNDPNAQKSSRLGGSGIGTKSGDMVAAFTCGKCEFRMVKKFSKHAYTKGIVIVECPQCEVRHLLADNLGWFVDESRNIEDILRERGESVIRIGQDVQVEPPSRGPDPEKAQ